MENHYGHLLSTMWKYAYGHRLKMVVAYAMFVCANIVIMAGPYVLGLVLNEIQVGGDGMLMRVMWLLIFYVSLDFWLWIFHGPARVMERTIAFYVMKHFNEHMFDIIAKLPLKWHKDHHSGNVISRVNKASEALGRFANNGYEEIQTIVTFFL